MAARSQAIGVIGFWIQRRGSLMSNHPATLAAATVFVACSGFLLAVGGGKSLADGRAQSRPLSAAWWASGAKTPAQTGLEVAAFEQKSNKPERTGDNVFSSPAVVAPGGRSPIELATADRLGIKFQGYSELTGEYRIGADGSISVPVIGRVPIGEMTAPELEALLAERITRLTGRETFVTVEVAEYRGIVVAGYVARPGSIPWRPRMTVLQAVALSGGTYRGQGDGGAVVSDDTALVRLQKAVADQKRGLAAMARLEAERRNLSSIETPAKLIELVGEAQAREVIAAQQSALVSRRASVEAKKAALARSIEMANREFASLDESARRLREQLNTRRAHKAKIDGLEKKGIIRSERLIDETTRVFDLEDRTSTVAVALARVQTTLAELERDRVNLDYERQADIDQEIIKVGRDIAQLDIDIEAERLKYRKITGTEPPLGLLASEPNAKRLGLSYKIIRQQPQGTQTLSPDQMTELRPDDVLVVSFE